MTVSCSAKNLQKKTEKLNEILQIYEEACGQKSTEKNKGFFCKGKRGNCLPLNKKTWMM